MEVLARITDFFRNIDWSLPDKFAGDLSFLFLFIGASLLFGLVFGRFRLINILINTYIALAIVTVLPQAWFAFSDYGRALGFVAILIALTLVDRRLFDIHISSAGTDFFWRLIVTSVLVTGLIASILLSSLPQATALDFISLRAYGYFASSWALIFWTIFPILTLLFINKRLR